MSLLEGTASELESPIALGDEFLIKFSYRLEFSGHHTPLEISARVFQTTGAFTSIFKMEFLLPLLFGRKIEPFRAFSSPFQPSASKFALFQHSTLN